jgi:formylglycine-generating enzyme required for sulfatase activity
MTDTESNRALSIFLCHASGDKPAVRGLYRRLKADGFAPWLDEEDLLPGQDWQREIPKAVHAADVVIVCLSRGSINKAGYVQKEIKFALDVADEKPEGAIFLIPLKLEECEVPERLARWQWVNHFDANGYSRLLQSLRARARSWGLTIASITSTQIDNYFIIDGMEFVRVPAGKFLMGSTANNELASDSERLQHTVEIGYDYWIARYPVTNEQFAQFVATTNGEFSQGLWQTKADHPVVDVSWLDAMSYCEWLNNTWRDKLKDLMVRLPTEAEWEKAARGEYGNEWPWGNDFDRTKCNSREGGKGGTTPVGAYSLPGGSPYGTADMVGNVWEWCHSIYKPYPYQANDGRESEAGFARVLRGGSWDNRRNRVRCAYRGSAHAVSRFDDYGFRVVVSPNFHF